jgi:hypothetical protein
MSDAEDMQDRIRALAYELWQEAGEPDGPPSRFWHMAERQVHGDETQYDKTLEQSFPASDPPANSGITE